MAHFKQRVEDCKLMDYRSPLCFESLRDYFHTMTRGVYKKYGSDIDRFKEGLGAVAKELIEVLATCTNKTVRNSETLLKDNAAKRILVYSYSKSVSLALTRLAKQL